MVHIGAIFASFAGRSRGDMSTTSPVPTSERRSRSRSPEKNDEAVNSGNNIYVANLPNRVWPLVLHFVLTESRHLLFCLVVEQRRI